MEDPKENGERRTTLTTSLMRRPRPRPPAPARLRPMPRRLVPCRCRATIARVVKAFLAAAGDLVGRRVRLFYIGSLWLRGLSGGPPRGSWRAPTRLMGHGGPLRGSWRAPPDAAPKP